MGEGGGKGKEEDANVDVGGVVAADFEDVRDAVLVLVVVGG